MQKIIKISLYICTYNEVGLWTKWELVSAEPRGKLDLES